MAASFVFSLEVQGTAALGNATAAGIAVFLFSRLLPLRRCIRIRILRKSIRGTVQQCIGVNHRPAAVVVRCARQSRVSLTVTEQDTSGNKVNHVQHTVLQGHERLQDAPVAVPGSWIQQVNPVRMHTN